MFENYALFGIIGNASRRHEKKLCPKTVHGNVPITIELEARNLPAFRQVGSPLSKVRFFFRGLLISLGYLLVDLCQNVWSF